MVNVACMPVGIFCTKTFVPLGGHIISCHILSLVLIVGYGVQAGPNNGQQIKGTIQRYTEDVQTNLVFLSHTNIHQESLSIKMFSVWQVTVLEDTADKRAKAMVLNLCLSFRPEDWARFFFFWRLLAFYQTNILQLADNLRWSVMALRKMEVRNV